MDALIRHYKIKVSSKINEVLKSINIDQEYSTSSACELVWEVKLIGGIIFPLTVNNSSMRSKIIEDITLFVSELSYDQIFYFYLFLLCLFLYSFFLIISIYCDIILSFESLMILSMISS